MKNYNLRELKIEVTYQCPLACIHCSSDAHIKNNLQMDKGKCISILKEAIKMGVKKVAFSGGEPLIWEGLEDAIEYCHLRNIETTIYTSGNCTNTEQIFEKIAAKGLNKAVFSLYSSEELEHIRITRKRDSYRATIDAIQIARKNGIETELHFVAMRANYVRLPQVVKLGKIIGTERVSVLRFVPQGRGKLLSNRGVLSKQQNNELRESIINLRMVGYDIRTGSPWNVLWLNNNPMCMAAQDRMIIAPDLRVYPCDAFKQVEFEEIVPDDKYSIIENRTLEECWEKSGYLNKIREKQNNLPSKPCLDCEKYNNCKSGCLAQKYLFYGNLDQNPDPICMRGII